MGPIEPLKKSSQIILTLLDDWSNHITRNEHHYRHSYYQGTHSRCGGGNHAPEKLPLRRPERNPFRGQSPERLLLPLLPVEGTIRRRTPKALRCRRVRLQAEVPALYRAV